MRYLFFGLLLLVACTPNVTSKTGSTPLPTLPDDAPVYVLQVNDLLPSGTEFVGEFRVGKADLTANCTYDIALEAARSHARTKGANVLYVSEIKVPPAFGTLCYQLRGNMYRATDEAVTDRLRAIEDARLASQLPADADFARVYFFRPPATSGSAVSYRVYDRTGNELGQAKNGSHFYHDFTEFGPLTLIGKNVAADTLRLDVRPGQEYFVHTALRTNFPVAGPTLRELPADVGRQEYERTRGRD